MPEADAGLAVVNAGGWGVFRVGYEPEHRLALAMRLPELTLLERAELLADTWATTLGGQSALREFLRLASYLGLESDPAPWSSVAAALNLINRIALPEDRGALHEAVAALIGPVHQHLGFDARRGESERTPTLRALAINLLGTVGTDEGVRTEAARRFDASPIGGGSGQPIPPDIETATLDHRDPAGAPRRLRRAARALPEPPPRPRRRCARSAHWPPSLTSTCACAPSTWP